MAAVSGGDVGMSRYAGDLFLALADQGRLVLDAEAAEEVIAGLERTLDVLARRVRLLDAWREGLQDARALPQPAVDAVFADQIAPGGADEALRELPKYVEALRRAARRPG
jgi:hypothetical protein